MSNKNWVCFDCRNALRRPWNVGSTGNGTPLCPDCKKPCQFIGHKIAVPPKRDGNGWKQLRDYINECRQSFREDKAQIDAQQKHEIERRILELQTRLENKDRDGLIKKLREELEALTTN